MRVFVVRNPTPRMRGYLHRLGVEVDPNVFVLDVTAEDAAEAWDWLTQRAATVAGCRVTLIEPATGKPAFSIKGFGETEPRTVDVDGVQLRFRPRKKTQN